MHSYNLRSTDKPNQLAGQNQEEAKQSPDMLFNAVELDLLVETRHSLRNTNIDINEPDDDGNSVLFYALKNRHPQIANLLIQHGAKVIATNMDLKGVDLTGVNLRNVDLTGFNLAGAKMDNLQLPSDENKWICDVDKSKNLTGVQGNSSILLGLWHAYNLCLKDNLGLHGNNLLSARKIKQLIDAINLEKNISLTQIRKEWQSIRDNGSLELSECKDIQYRYDQTVFNLINNFLNHFKEDYVFKRPYSGTEFPLFKRQRTENNNVIQEPRYAQWSPPRF